LDWFPELQNRSMEEALRRAIQRTMIAPLKVVERKALDVTTVDTPYELKYPNPELLYVSSIGDDVLFDLDLDATTPDSPIIYDYQSITLERPEVSKLVFKALTASSRVRILSFMRTESK